MQGQLTPSALGQARALVTVRPPRAIAHPFGIRGSISGPGDLGPLGQTPRDAAAAELRPGRKWAANEARVARSNGARTISAGRFRDCPAQAWRPARSGRRFTREIALVAPSGLFPTFDARAWRRQ
jgi:hypothetical protein